MLDDYLQARMLEGGIAHLQAKSAGDEYRWNPVKWAKDVLDVDLWSKQREILWSVVNHKKTAVKSSHAIGKGAPLDEVVPTPTGLKKLGDVQVGDFVFDHEGNPTRVTYVSPVQVLPMYRVTFSDGNTVDVWGDHLWQVYDTETTRVRGVMDWRDHWDKTITLSTYDLLEMGLKNKGNGFRWKIPLARPLNLPPAQLPVDPYIYGLWLGDGTVDRGRLTGNTTDKAFYADVLREAGFTASVWNYPSGKAVRVNTDLNKSLIEFGLNVKRIDPKYLWSSETQRRALLAGLMDSDGTSPGSKGQLSLNMTNPDLAEDVQILLASLGVKARCTLSKSKSKNGEHGTLYDFQWFQQTNPFRNRKTKWKPPKSGMSTSRSIRSIVPIDSVPGVCVSVENPLHTYLISRAFIPTHNTFTSAVAVCWWISTRPNSMVRSTAPTSYQVHELLWEEIRKMHAQHNLVGWVNLKDQWQRNLYGARIVVGSGQKPSDTNIHAFQGVHRPDGVLSVLDEGCGIDQNLYVASDAISTGRWDRVLSIGNPDNPDSEFGRIFGINNPKFDPDNPAWNLITVSAFDTPNFTGEEVPELVSRSLIQTDWVEERAAEWGEDSARYMSKILAEFPPQSDDAFFKQAVIDKAWDTVIEDPNTPPIMGVDVASSGNDYSTVALNRGGHVRIIDSWNHGDIVESTNRVFDLAERNGVHEIRLDAVGYGEAVAEYMKKDTRLAELNITLVPVKGSYAARDKGAHMNARAEQYDNLRLRMKQGKIDLDRFDEKIKTQLLAIKSVPTKTGAIQIESKADMKARGSKSPDELDAVVYAVADFDYLKEEKFPTGTKIYEDASDIIGDTGTVLDMLNQF